MPQLPLMVYVTTTLPFIRPVMIPEAEPIFATAESKINQMPPVKESVNVSGVPMQKAVSPLIVPAVGAGLMVIVSVAVAVPHELV